MTDRRGFQTPGPVRFLALACLCWAMLAGGRAWALSDADFLNLCAGEKGRAAPLALKKALAEGANVNYVGPRGRTPLMAFVSAHRETGREALAGLKVILAAGPNLEARSEEGGTALGYAILNQAGPRIIAALLAAGAEVQAPIGPKGGLPPLWLAAGLEPDPLVSALLWAGGAESQGRAARNELLAQAGRQPEVLRFLKGALEADSEEGLPLFTAAPADPALQASLKEMDARLRPPRNAEDAWLDYLQWQIDLPLNVAARRDLFGRTEASAWLDEYAFRLAQAEAGPEHRPRDRVILPGPRPAGAALEAALAAAGRQVLVLVHPENRMVAYETASGRELWRRQPGGPTQILPVGRLLLAATTWSGTLGEAVVLDPLTGAVLLTLTDLDDPKWIMDAGQRALIISTDFSLDIFDLSSWKNRGWSWRDILDSQDWNEARLTARAMQNKILADYGEVLDDEGRFTRPGGALFQPAPAPDREMLDRARASLKSQGYNGEPTLLAVERKNRPAFILGPAGPEAADQPLILVNPFRNRLDALTVPEQTGEHALTWGRLAASGADFKISPGPAPPSAVSENFKFSPDETPPDAPEKFIFSPDETPPTAAENLKFSTEKTLPAENLKISTDETLTAMFENFKFSPGGNLLAVTENTGAIHFFAARNQGRYLVTLPPQARLAEGGDDDLLVRDLHLLALLTDDQTPTALFYAPAKDRHFLAEVGLGGNIIHTRPLMPGSGVGLTAWAATPAGHWAAGLSDGALWLFSPGQEGPVLLAPPPAAPWSALAFSGDGQTLAAAAGQRVRLFKSRRPEPLTPTLAGEVSRLALDQGGRRLWAALNAPGQTGEILSDRRPALATVDLSGPGQAVYQATEGQVLDLGYDQAKALARALVEAPPSDGYNRPQGPRTPGRWAQGRADLWRFDHLKPAGSAGLRRYDPDRLFAGLAQAELFHQQRSPDRPFITLGRENLADRRPGRLTATGRQRRLSPAAFDLSGRLAVFPELEGGSFHVFNLAAGREIARGLSGDPEGLLGAAFLRDASRLITFGRGGLIRLWSFKGPEPLPLLTWTFAEGGRWAAVTPEGLFDADDPVELEHILRSVGRNPVLPLSRFAANSFFPGLSAKLLAPPPPEGGSKPKSK